MFAAGEITRELANDPRTEPGKISRQWKAAVTDACIAVTHGLHCAFVIQPSIPAPVILGCACNIDCMGRTEHNSEIFASKKRDLGALPLRLQRATSLPASLHCSKRTLVQQDCWGNCT